VTDFYTDDDNHTGVTSNWTKNLFYLNLTGEGSVFASIFVQSVPELALKRPLLGLSFRDSILHRLA
jgi:hypothetical protein